MLSEDMYLLAGFIADGQKPGREIGGLYAYACAERLKDLALQVEQMEHTVVPEEARVQVPGDDPKVVKLSCHRRHGWPS